MAEQQEGFNLTETAPGVFTFEIRDAEVLEALAWVAQRRENESVSEYLAVTVPGVIMESIGSEVQVVIGEDSVRKMTGGDEHGLPTDAPAHIRTLYEVKKHQAEAAAQATRLRYNGIIEDGLSRRKRP